MNIVGYIPGATMKYFGEQFLIFVKKMETKKININGKLVTCVFANGIHNKGGSNPNPTRLYAMCNQLQTNKLMSF